MFACLPENVNTLLPTFIDRTGSLASITGLHDGMVSWPWTVVALIAVADNDHKHTTKTINNMS